MIYKKLNEIYGEKSFGANSTYYTTYKICILLDEDMKDFNWGVGRGDQHKKAEQPAFEELADRSQTR